MHIEVRDARPEDTEFVYPLVLEFMRAEDDASESTSGGMELRTRKESFETDARSELLREFHEPNERFLVAILDDAIVGYARGEIVDREDAFFETVRVGVLHALVVS